MLSAVLRVDMVGSTVLLAADGVDASIIARRRMSELIDATCAAGSVIDIRGDGTVMAFRSAEMAVRSALSLQDTAAGADFDLRAAITIAEVAADGESLPWAVERRSGRLETACPAGSVVIDGRVRRAVAGTTLSVARAVPLPAVDSEAERIDAARSDVLLDAAIVTASGTAHPSSTVHLSSTAHLSGDARSTDSEPPTELPEPSGAKLDAVLFSNVAATLDAATAALARSISSAAIDAHGGVVIDTNGVGHVACFSSCTAALDAARRIHDDVAAAPLRADSTGPFEFSVGISMGEVLVTDRGGFGLALVEAARLLDHADPGTTAFTVDVAEIAHIEALGQTADESGCDDGTTTVEDCGEHVLKGLPAPTAIRQLRSGTLRAALDLPLVFGRDETFALTGREADLDLLHRRWEEALDGDVRPVVVSGEEGVGKTRLVRELARSAHADGAIVLHGVCTEDVDRPFVPIIAALTRAAALDAALADAVAAGDGPLGVLLGPAGLPDEQPDGEADQPGDDQFDQFDLFDAVDAAFARLAALRPLLVVIDDVQWADIDTVQMIEHLMTRAEPCRAMFVTTCRDEHLGPGDPAQRLLQSSRGGRRIEQRRLDRLLLDDIIGMLESRTGTDLTDEQLAFAEKVVEITGGSPLYVEELINHLRSTGVLVYDSESGWSLTVDPNAIAIPDSVIDLLAERSARLGAEAVEVLTTAAVMGQSFDVEVLTAVSGRDLDTVLDIVEAAGQARLIRESDGGGSCVFTDEICRAALLRGLRPSRRALVHRRVAEGLEQLRPHLIDQLVVHWSASIGGEARTKAVRYLRLAGERDMASGAWESSADRHRRALDLLVVDGVDDVEALSEVHHRLGASLRTVGDAGYRVELLQAAALARERGDVDLLARCAFAMMRPGAWYPEAMLVDDDIVDMCEDALLLLAEDDPLRPRLLAALATNLAYEDDIERVRSIIDEAQRLARDSGDLGLLGTTLAAELISFHDPDRFLRRRELAEEIRRIGRATGDRNLLFTGSWFLVLDLVQDGSLDEAIPLADELRRVVEARREYWPSFLVSHFGTAISIARCDPDAASLVETERAMFEHQPVDWFGVSVIQQATIAMGRGTLADMLLPFAEAAEEHNDPAWSAKWDFAFSKAYLDTGDHDKALAAIETEIEPAKDNYWMASTYHLGLLGLLTGRADVCRTVLDRLEAFRGRFAIIGLGACVAGQISTALGQAHLGLGDLDAAEELFREAVERCDRARFAYFATNARRFLAETLIAHGGRDDEATALLHRVLAEADQYEFSIERREAERLLTRI